MKPMRSDKPAQDKSKVSSEIADFLKAGGRIKKVAQKLVKEKHLALTNVNCGNTCRN